MIKTFKILAVIFLMALVTQSYSANKRYNSLLTYNESSKNSFGSYYVGSYTVQTATAETAYITFQIPLPSIPDTTNFSLDIATANRASPANVDSSDWSIRVAWSDDSTGSAGAAPVGLGWKEYTLGTDSTSWTNATTVASGTAGYGYGLNTFNIGQTYGWHKYWRVAIYTVGNVYPTAYGSKVTVFVMPHRKPLQ